jgi:acyl dehydratase
MLAYNRANDPWPIHVDPDTAAKSPFGGLIANRGYGPARTVGRLFAFTPSYLYARPAVPGSDNRS